MSNLENTISHPRQCVGCCNLISVNGANDINDIEYVCQTAKEGDFFQDCEENTAYSGGSFDRQQKGLTETPYEEFLNK